MFEIDIGASHLERFRKPQSGGGKEAKEREVSGWPQRVCCW